MFILDRPTSTKPTFIFIKTTLIDGPFKASLCVKVQPAHWDKEKKRAEITGLDRPTIEENKSINALISDIDKFIEARARDARYSGKHLTCPELHKKIEEVTGRKKTSSVLNFYNHCEGIIEEMANGKILTKRGKRYSPGTVESYNYALEILRLFNPSLHFNAVTLDFYKDFVKWCNDKDYSMNYIGLILSKLVVLMKEAQKQNLHVNTTFLDEDFKILMEKNDDISLTEKDLQKLYDHKFVGKYDLARDWAIIHSYLGLRVSDIQVLQDRNINSGMVTIVNEKTDTKVVIPINSKVKSILKKWNGIPPKIEKRTFQNQVKEVCRQAGFDQPVIYFMTKGGARKDYYLKKYELVSPHTFRRTFITNLLEAGVPDNQVMHLAGIKKHETLLRYKKTKPERTAEIMKKHRFFK